MRKAFHTCATILSFCIHPILLHEFQETKVETSVLIGLKLRHCVQSPFYNNNIDHVTNNHCEDFPTRLEVSESFELELRMRGRPHITKYA